MYNVMTIVLSIPDAYRAQYIDKFLSDLFEIFEVEKKTDEPNN